MKQANLRSAGRSPNQTAAGQRHVWWSLGVDTVLAVYFYVFMEWLFFVTKPSFMDAMGLGAKISILLSAAFLVGFGILVVFLLLYGFSRLPLPGNGKDLLLWAAAAIPAGILAVTALLLVDNFTYTVLKFGIVSTAGGTRGVYAVGFLGLFGFFYRWMLTRLKKSSENARKAERSVPNREQFVTALLLVSLVVTLAGLECANLFPSAKSASRLGRRPNIILLGSDGVNADNMSVYGYERDTTPNLRRLADRSLIVENAFTNSSSTPGSLLSVMTSKLPLKTRVIYPPDILRGKDAFQHLPGILRNHGYLNVEISFPHFADASVLNVQNGFDRVNDKFFDQEGVDWLNRLASISDGGYLLSIMTERITDRLMHIFYIRKMENPYRDITGSKGNIGDATRLGALEEIIRTVDQPFFVHMHFMGTHGTKFPISKEHAIFSAGETQDEIWMPDFYDDAIHQFDGIIGDVWQVLEETGKLDNTILIVMTDHNQKWLSDKRIPLLFHFPNDDYAGRIKVDGQNIDIAPTVLDYLNLPIPGWMEGKSLLSGDLPPARYIFSTGVMQALLAQDETGFLAIDQSRKQPPFYQFEYIRVISCQKWYMVTLHDFSWQTGEIPNHSAPCPPDTLPREEQVKEAILQKLTEDGFDDSTLKAYFFPQAAAKQK